MRGFSSIRLQATRPKLIATAGPFIIVAGAFQLFDGLQAIGAGLARGLKDSTVPMVLAIASYWGIGFTSAYLLAFPLGFGGIGIWYGFMRVLRRHRSRSMGASTISQAATGSLKAPNVVPLMSKKRAVHRDDERPILVVHCLRRRCVSFSAGSPLRSRTRLMKRRKR